MNRWFGSVRARMVAVVVGVVAVAVASTAWLATRSAEEAVRESASQSLENDAAIYQALVDHGLGHSDWSAVEPLLADLAVVYDRRIALTDGRGRILADSDRAGGGSSRSLPEAATAQLDPWNPALGMWGVTLADPMVVAVPTEAVAEAVACLDSNAVGYEMVDAGGQLLPQPAAAFDDTTFAVFVTCTDPMYGAMPAPEVGMTGGEVGVDGRPTGVAPAVLLYLGTATELNPLAGPSAWRTLGIVGAILAAAAAAAWWLSRRTTRPFQELAVAAGRLEAGDLAHRVGEGGPVEARAMSHAFNSLAATLQRTDAQRRQMVADIAHELRNPLVTLNGTLEAIEDGVYEPTPAVIASLAQDAEHLTRMVVDLQDLAVADAGGLVVRCEPCDLAEVAAMAVEAHRATAAAGGVALAVVTDGDGPLVVSADPARMRQVLGNLLSNAVRHTPAGGSVTVTVRGDGAEVRDTGEGIAVEDLPHLFDRFWRADPARARHTGGTGLGLAIAKELVEAHGARIGVESAPGEGAVFTIRGLQPSR